ncbi:uncharacterized protein [Notothenia coriiceps]|uniref:Ig-like domain-containing protein n=1 Tax=Notothenia coriiceps TaxID=8208 RepID=A0A6I9MY13_9TELE|nr:PREDICTED: uncharacterized protein LOC104942887 [Notothenia coriiceps]
MFKIYVLLVTLFRAYGALLYAEPGQNVTLKCFYTSIDNNLCWYKQDSDSAIYYCGKISGVVTEFDNGTFLVLKESSLRYLLQQPESDSVKPGGSVTLNCTVHTGTNDTEQSVYWFKKENTTNSKHVGTMYIHTNGSSQCVQSLGSEFPAWSCVHSLSKQNVSLSDAGTYYCAVALCGEIIFGKGTRLEVGEKRQDIFPLLVHCVVAALIVSVILNIIVIGILCKVSRRENLPSGGVSPPHTSVAEYTPNIENQESKDLEYEALDFKTMRSKSKRKRSTEDETVYSTVRLSDLK